MQKKIEYHTVEDYYNLPEGSHVELIDGVFYDLYLDMAAPGRVHQKLSIRLSTIIQNHIDSKGGKCEVFAAPFSVQLKENDQTIVEPDISVICDTNKLNDVCCIGAPDWIIEIVSPSNPSHDYLIKLNLYRNAGVREYWIVDPGGKTISVYTGDFHIPVGYSFEDKIKPGIFDDLVIDFNDVSKHL